MDSASEREKCLTNEAADSSSESLSLNVWHQRPFLSNFARKWHFFAVSATPPPPPLRDLHDFWRGEASNGGRERLCLRLWEEIHRRRRRRRRRLPFGRRREVERLSGQERGIRAKKRRRERGLRGILSCERERDLFKVTQGVCY